MIKYFFTVVFIAFLLSCKDEVRPIIETGFYAEKTEDQIQIFEKGKEKALVTQNARPDHRPYLHPILAPNSQSELTQYSPGHHKHQTGLYWGFTRVNGNGASPEELKKWFYSKDKPEEIKKKIGRDFFHNPGGSHWQKVSMNVLIPEGEELKWQTIYNLLDENAQAILKETQTWTFAEKDGKYLLELEWNGEAQQDITINEFDYGGMFLRMPWHKGIEGEAVNAARQKNNRAEGQRAMWVDVGMEIEGLDQWGHITIFDHPDNDGFPQAWRVDGQLGVGPVRAKMGDWHIKKGESTTIRHGVLAYSGVLNDVEMQALWSDYIGDQGMYNDASLWRIAQREGREAKFLTPQEAIDNTTIKEGYKVNMYASEPMITQPMAFCWDNKGRMWIAENRDYESRRDGFSNDGKSRILILEDTDRDGVADSKKVFIEGIPFPAAIAIGFDGLYLGAPPNLLFVPDKDKDDKADEEDIEVLLTGWGIRDRHETINSLHWGPDGWLYGLEGFATPSKIRKPQGEGKLYGHKEPFPTDLLEGEGVDIDGGVWRYHPTKHEFEVVAHGFSNPWGVDYDAKGQMFISACVIPHLFHVVQGGIYHRQGGKHFNPYVYKDIRTIVDHRHRSAHGGARVYQSDAFPEEEQGRIFMANIHEHNVLSDILTPNGSGFVASHGDDFMMANNAQWIGFSMEVGPEGGLYVLDWHDADICGNDVVNKETGRVFRIMPETSLAKEWNGRYDDLNSLTDLQLAEYQLSKSDWHTRRARVILQKRGAQASIDAEAIDKLKDILQNEGNSDSQLKALWALHVSQSINEGELAELLENSDPYLRAWAIQFLTEDRNVSDQVLAQMVRMARTEKSAVVRLYLASALQRLQEKDRWGIANALVSHIADSDDPNIPFMIWFGIEPLVSDDVSNATQLAISSKIPMITSHIARRLVDADQLEAVTAALGKRSNNLKAILEGMISGLEGRADITEPSNWENIYNKLKSNSSLSDLAVQVAQSFGSVAAAKEMLATLKNPDAELAKRQNAITSLASQKWPELESELADLLRVDELKTEAIRAMASYESASLGALLLQSYDGLNLEHRQEAIQTLSSRRTYARQLAKAINEEKISRKDIPPYTALQLKRVLGSGFVEMWGPIEDLASNKEAEYAKYQRLLSDKALTQADPHAGRAVYRRVCFACHKMYDEGGVIGPDLTGSNRQNTAYLLSNVIEPSAEIQDDYLMVVVTTQDGRIFSGNVIAENERQLTMRIVGQDEVLINQSDIRSREQTTQSMMPEGLLGPLSDREVLDLFAYMRTLEQVEMREEL